MGIDHFAKATDAKQAALGLLEVEDGHLPAAGPEGFDHRGGGFLAAAEVVGGDLRDDLRVAAAVGDVDGKDGDAGGIRFGDHRADRLGVAGGENDRRYLADDEVLDLIPLLGDILVGADDLSVERLLARLGGDRVADELEEWIVEREQRDADRAGRHPAGGTGRGAARRRIGLGALRPLRPGRGSRLRTAHWHKQHRRRAECEAGDETTTGQGRDDASHAKTPGDRGHVRMTPPTGLPSSPTRKRSASPGGTLRRTSQLPPSNPAYNSPSTVTGSSTSSAASSRSWSFG